MNSEVKSANEVIRQSQASSHRYNMFKSLLGDSDAIPLDGNGIFSLVKSDRYNQMLRSLQESQRIKDELQEQCYSINLNAVQKNKELELLKNQVRKFKENEGKFEEHIYKITQQLKKSQIKIVELQTSLRDSLIRKTPSDIISRQSQADMPALTVSTAVQTIWEQSVAEVINEAIKDINDQKATFSAEEKLYGLLKANADKFQGQFREKMNKLQETQMLVDRWEAQKEQYRLENQELKTKLQARDIEDQKLRLWKEGISEMIQRVEKTINQPEGDMIIAQEGENEPDNEWKKDAVKQARIAEFRIRMREAQNEMRVEQEGEEEAPVNNLVRLSQKLRTLVQGMLIEAKSEQ